MPKLPGERLAKIRDVERARETTGRKVSLRCDICGQVFETVTQKVRHRRDHASQD